MPASRNGQSKYYDVVVVGAGAAGIGVGAVLKAIKTPSFLILDRHEVGASFLRWPRETRLLSPSFTSNGFGFLDLNAIALQTSPAYTLSTEHPTGARYATYLKAVASHLELPIREGFEVTDVTRDDDGGFTITANGKTVRTRFVIWATGEFQFPRLDAFPGAELCRHSATFRSWAEQRGQEFFVIGGYESGIDAAVGLIDAGKRVCVVDRAEPWSDDIESDPSKTLSPFTLDRLRPARESGRLELIANFPVAAVERQGRGYVVRAEDGRTKATPAAPILAGGFRGGASQLANLFAFDDNGRPLLTEHDESTATPGVFLIGPQVRHENVIFCFIYKFRQRFAVVVDAIARRLELDVAPLAEFRKHGMYLDDLTCCDAACQC